MATPAVQRAFRAAGRGVGASAHGLLSRKATMEAAQRDTPYPDFATYLFATQNFRSLIDANPGGPALDQFGAGRQSRENEWNSYRSVRSIRQLTVC